MSRDSLYQQLRGHLAYLNLAAAAEALPAELDNATKAKQTHTEFLERLLRDRGRPPPRPAATPGRCGSPNFPAPGGSTTSTSPRSPPSTQR